MVQLCAVIYIALPLTVTGMLIVKLYYKLIPIL